MSLLLLALVACTPSEDAVVPLTLEAGPDVSVPLGRTVTLQATTEGASTVTWTLGDGTVASGRQVEHTYTEPGNYGVVVQATSDTGETRSDSLVVTAYPQPASVPAKTSSTLVIDEVRQVAWSVIDETDALIRVDLQTGDVAEVFTCDSPRTVSLDAGVVWVACEGDDLVQAIDAQSSALVGRYQLATGARPFAVVARDSEAWVSCQGTGSVVRLRRGAGPATTTFAVGPDPRALALLPDGSVWVTRFRGDGTGVIYRVDDDPVHLARSIEQDSDTRTRGVPVLMQSLAVTPDGAHVVVGGQLSNTDRGLWRDGQPLTFETTLRGIIRGVAVDTDEPVAGYDRQFDDHGHAGPIAFGPLGARLFVAHPHAGVIQVLDGWTGAARGSLLDAGIGLTAIVPSADGQRLWTHAAIDREIREYDLTQLVVSPLPSRIYDAIVEEPLSELEHRGQFLFNDAVDTRLAKHGYIACASCHPDGRDDGLVWDFTDRGEGLRNTITLEGRSGTGMGPMHWTGNFDEVQDFEHDIRHGNSGTGLLSDADFDAAGGPMGTALAGLSEDLDALAAYVATFDTLPRSPNPLVAPAPDRAVFEALGCDICHAGALYTDSAVGVRHDVGTVQDGTGGRLGGDYSGFDTPTLLGVWATPPYLHDGSASTLEDAVRAHDLGGEPISDDDMAALVRLMESL